MEKHVLENGSSIFPVGEGVSISVTPYGHVTVGTCISEDIGIIKYGGVIEVQNIMGVWGRDDHIRFVSW